MKKSILFSFFTIIIIIIIIFFVYSKKDTKQSEDMTVPLSSDFVSVKPTIESIDAQELSTQEINNLLFIREEEKLARDVYLTLYEKWNLPIFLNISKSEQTHTDAVQSLLLKYNIKDPVTDNSVGVFVNKELNKLYIDLVNQGQTSLEDALLVGAYVEDLDISDLKRFISETDNEDIVFVYENLMRGSRNHLRSFVSQIESRGGSYKAQYITDQEFKEIISSPRETGSGSGRGMGK